MFDQESEAKREPFVTERFQLRNTDHLFGNQPEFGFGGFGELVYYRTYSRLRADGRQERWADTVLRIIEGCMSIRKDWYKRVGVAWDEKFWQDTAYGMSDSLFKMHWLAPGRGLYAMGTEHVYRVGAMPLFNCGASHLRSASYKHDLAWIMDALMCGVGVGVGISTQFVPLQRPGQPETYHVEDSRQGWVASVVALCEAFLHGAPLPVFNYDGIRKAGTPLKGIGGVASGPDPLRILHERMMVTFAKCLHGHITFLRMRADHVNQIGACITMGDVRRSAEMLISEPSYEFLRLKDYARNPDRVEWGDYSNNTIAVDGRDDIAWVAEQLSLMKSGERPGVLNRELLRLAKDPADLVNPCGEIPLVDKELCNVVEVVPERCSRDETGPDFGHNLREALHFATLYAQTVALLPTHSVQTNRILAKHRRIGVSKTGISGEFDVAPRGEFERWLRGNWARVKGWNERFAREAKVPTSIFVTTNKPSGTVSQLAGVTSGMHWRIDEYALRRIRVGVHSPIKKALDASGMKSEVDPTSGASVYAFPIHTHGKRNERQVSLAEQFELLLALQQHWADNSVSCTLKHDKDMPTLDLHQFLLQAIPKVKCLSILSHEEQEGGYALPPYEAISKEQYEAEVAALPKLDWRAYTGDGEDAQFCDSKSCDLRSLGVDGKAGHKASETDEGLDPV